MANVETEWGQLLRGLNELCGRLSRDFVVLAQRRPGRQLIVDDELVAQLAEVWKRALLESARLGAIYQREKSKRVAAAREAPARQRQDVKELRVGPPPLDHDWICVVSYSEAYHREPR